MKLLLIEDEWELLSALQKGFEKRGFIVDIASDGNEGSYLAEVNEYDVIVLDLNLPYKDGIEILKEIRNRSDRQKVIILSARSSVVDKIEGLDLGANDYVSKPFDFLELEARVRSLARRVIIQNDSVRVMGNVSLDTVQKKVRVKEHILDLAPKEYAILQYLILHQGAYLSAEQLIEHVWDSEADVFQSSVKVHVSNLRKRLVNADASITIKAMRGMGYTLEEVS